MTPTPGALTEELPVLSQQNIELFREFIQERCGLTFGSHAHGLLTRALFRRMALLGLDGQKPDAPRAYLRQLRHDEAEFCQFISLITINETYFFREPEQIGFLVDTLLPRLMARRTTPVRIFSAGCSTGEEPYSIAMALHEKLGGLWSQRVIITAGDLDREALEKARAGIYSAFSFRGISETLRERHFQNQGKGFFQLDQRISRQVKFIPFNLLTDPYALELHQQDVILFRNVAIYFDRPTREAIQRRLATLLNHPGYLLMGATETLSNDFGQLTLAEEGERFYFTNVAHSGASPQSLPGVGASALLSGTGYLGLAPVLQTERTPSPRPPLLDRTLPTPSPPRVELSPPVAREVDYPQLLTLVREKNYDQAMNDLTAAMHYQPEDQRLRLLKAHIQFHRRQLEESASEARIVLERDPWSLEGFLLLGKIHHHQGKDEEALRWFRQAVYVQPGCWEAHYFLADLYRRTGEKEQAAREYRLVLKQITGEAGPGAEPLFPLAVPLSDMRIVCQRHLAALSS